MNLAQWAADRASRLIHGGMNHTDYTAWRSARSLDDIGRQTALWLERDIATQPGYPPGRGPDPETMPHITVLAAANRTGFVTIGSQPGTPDGQQAQVQGLISETDLAWLTTVTHGTPLLVDIRCRGREHHGHRSRWSCPRSTATDFLIWHCPAAMDAIRSAWYIQVTDPQPGRNTWLWPALASYAGLTVTS